MPVHIATLDVRQAGAVQEVLPLNKIAQHVLDHLRATVGQALSRV